MIRKLLRRAALVGAAGAGVLFAALWLSLESLPERLAPPGDAAVPKLQVLDRLGAPLSYTFASEWNVSDLRPLKAFPPFLATAFIEAEDARFFSHSGVDWLGRCHALWQNLTAGRVVRGASTITEQVVRMLHPRPRTVWSRLVEGIEAQLLERRFSKGEILEFYLNQVPYAARRRGVVQAARFYFNRDLETLSQEEVLTLAVLVRSPQRLDLYGDSRAAAPGSERLADRLLGVGALSPDARASLDFSRLELQRARLPVRADHFVRFLQSQKSAEEGEGRVASTLDSAIQGHVQKLLDTRVRALAADNVTDGAVLVVENRSAEVLAWANAGGFSDDVGSHFDGVLTARQPGSTLKPLLYALALERGWTAATVIDDAPLSEAVGAGLHNFRNYSRVYYGELSLREALGNSLNVPAVKTVQFVGKQDFLAFLKRAGFGSLRQPASFYGEGLALGNGEVTLYELVRAYTALANRGVLRELVVTRDDTVDEARRPHGERRAIMTPEVASIVADILSDPEARRREFGSGGLLRLPVQTAVKTGTSTDYRDAWAIGFSARYTVGVWLGNMNRTSMREVSGARGPALLLRSIFAELERAGESEGLSLSQKLERRSVCPLTGKLAGARCPHREELFVPGSAPQQSCSAVHDEPPAAHEPAPLQGERPLKVTLPTPGLHIARDPRIPDSSEAFPFALESVYPLREVRWFVDDREVARRPGNSPRYLWALAPGRHTVRAEAVTEGGQVLESEGVGFWVR